MKKITSQFFSVLVLCLVLLISSYSSAQVGINITPSTVPALDATKTLDVNGDTYLRGDARLDGAFLPGNAAGGVNEILVSQGTATPPVWGPGFINMGQIDKIGKFYVFPINIAGDPPGPAPGTYTIYTVADPEMTATTVVSWHFTGAFPACTGGCDLEYGNNLRVFVETRAGQVLFHFYNSSNRNLVNFEIQYVAFYNQ